MRIRRLFGLVFPVVVVVVVAAVVRLDVHFFR